MYQRERATLSVDQVRAFVEEFRQVYPHRHAEVATLAYTGIRAGELFGLKWDVIDWDEGAIEVRRSAPKGQMTDTTKSGAPRIVPMICGLKAILREQHKRLMSDGHPGLKHNLVFPSRNGKVRYSSAIRKPMRLVSEAMGLGINVTPQVLRRSYNSVAVAAGIPELVVRAIMGHASPEMTRHYAGFDIERLRSAVGPVFEAEEES